MPSTPTINVTVAVPASVALAGEIIDAAEQGSRRFLFVAEQIARAIMDDHERHPAPRPVAAYE